MLGLWFDSIEKVPCETPEMNPWYLYLQATEEVEITMTSEIMVDSSQTMVPWRETTLVAEIQADPMAVSLILQLWDGRTFFYTSSAMPISSEE